MDIETGRNTVPARFALLARLICGGAAYHGRVVRIWSTWEASANGRNRSLSNRGPDVFTP